MLYDRLCAFDVRRGDKIRAYVRQESVIELRVGNSSSVIFIPFRLQKHGKGVDWCSNNEPRSFVKIS